MLLGAKGFWLNDGCQLILTGVASLAEPLIHLTVCQADESHVCWVHHGQGIFEHGDISHILTFGVDSSLESQVPGQYSQVPIRINGSIEVIASSFDHLEFLESGHTFHEF